MSTPRIVVRAVAVLAGPAVALVLLPLAVAQPLVRLRAGVAGVDDAAAVLAAGGLAILLAWTVLAGTVAVVSAASGRLGRAARPLADLVTPVVARQLLRLALGLAAVTGPPTTVLAASGALAAPASSPARADDTGAAALPYLATRLAVGRPVTGTRAADAADEGPALPRVHRPRTTARSTQAGPALAGARHARTAPPTQQPAQAANPPAPGWIPRQPERPAGEPVRRVRLPSVGLVTSVPRDAEAVPDEVVVRRGDTLWGIAARYLGPDAGDAEVAAEWPRWYAANHAVLGPDPDLILPGTVLHPPPIGRAGR